MNISIKNFVQKKQTGSALVEFAIGFPFLLFFTFATIDLSLMLIKKTQLDFAFEETMNLLALDDEGCADFQDSYYLEGYEDVLEMNLAKFKLDDEFNAQRGNQVVQLRYCQDNTTSYALFDEQAPAFIETTLTFNLGCTVCGLIPYLGNSLNQLTRNYYQAVNPEACYINPDQGGDCNAE